MSKHPPPRKSRAERSQKTENWLEITAEGPLRGKDIASQILIDTGSPGVLDLSKGPVSVLKAHLRVEEKDKVHSIEKKLKKLAWKVISYPYTGGDWTEKWKRWIRPVNVCGVFLVKPTWRRVAGGSRVVIEIDPGMAFGTGTHPSTKLCLKAMANLLGRKAPVALKVARKNARLNDVRVEFTRKPIGELKGSFNLIVSNIVSGELVKLAPLLAKRVREGGFIILSGILKEELHEVTAAYMRLGLRHFKTYTEGGWVCPVFERRA
jgi:ribosomal protein L11 methyltransferase